MTGRPSSPQIFGPFEAALETGAGASLPGNPRCCCVRVCQSPVLTRGSGGRRACSHPHGGVPLQEVAGLMKVLYERVAGIDVHKDMI